MKSALYIGRVRHRRFEPKKHDFTYDMAYFFLDLAETDRLFRIPFLFTTRGPAVLAFRPKDYFGGAESLDAAVRKLVLARLGKKPSGPIRVLTQLSYFGLCFNPVSIYYCYDDRDERVQFIVADVTNTPWNERHAYAVECAEGQPLDFSMPKTFHVSPFMPMEIDYRWRLSTPTEMLAVHMENFAPSTGRLLFDATMTMKRKKLGALSIAVTLASFPLLTMKAVVAIYFEALKLKVKGLRFFPHPATGDKP